MLSCAKSLFAAGIALLVTFQACLHLLLEQKHDFSAASTAAQHSSTTTTKNRAQIALDNLIRQHETHKKQGKQEFLRQNKDTSSDRDDDKFGEVQPTNASTTITDGDKANLYWNLSCPLEMSLFSASHIGGESFLERAEQARNLVLSERIMSKMEQDFLSLQSRRIIFVGDSLMRQVFISMSCLLWDHVESHSAAWFDKRHSRTQHKHSRQIGPHSKFEEARVRLQNRAEFIYHHGTGGLLKLGEDYTSHETEDWVQACSKKEAFFSNVLWTPEFGGEHVINERNATREKIRLGAMDVVIISGSVHGHRADNLRNIKALLQCMATKKNYPIILYVMTGADHFPTKDGLFDPSLLETDEEIICRTESLRRDLQHEELSMLHGKLPILAKDVVYLQYSSGNLHVGGKDCLHWIQPGIPDLIAGNISSYISSLASPWMLQT